MEKASKEEARISKIKATKEVKLQEDKKSRFIASIGVKVQLQLKLEKVQFMCKSSFGYSEVETYLNLFKDEEGNIVTYMGKNLLWEYLTLFGYTHEIDYDGDWFTQQAVNDSLMHSMQIEIKTNQNSENPSSNKNKPVKDEVSSKVFKIKNPRFISLTGTIKSHNEFNGVKQTQVQRPKIFNFTN